MMVFMTMGFSLEVNGFEEKREQHERERGRERKLENEAREKNSPQFWVFCVFDSNLMYFYVLNFVFMFLNFVKINIFFLKLDADINADMVFIIIIILRH